MNLNKGYVHLILRGGLGNQLFMLAAAYEFSKCSERTLTVDISAGFKNDKYRRTTALTDVLKLFEKEKKLIIISNKIVSLSMKHHSKFFKKVNNINFFHNFNSYKFVAMNDYFQSEKYFKNVDAEFVSAVAHVFEVKQLFCKTLGIHLRDFGRDELNLPLSYYENAITKLLNSWTIDRVLIIGEGSVRNTYFSKKISNLVKNSCADVVTRFDGELHEDFRDLSQCEYVILSNSTFSWWTGKVCENKKDFICVSAKVIDGFCETSWGLNDQLPMRWTKC